jgi:predicted tellurium resistance membrane protein TerC
MTMDVLALLSDPAAWASLAALTALEIVLGIDNLIFLSIVASRLPVSQQNAARRIGLSLALLMRLALLASIAWIVGLTQPIFSVGDFDVSWRDIIMLGGGLFLLAKGTLEIHHSMEEQHSEGAKASSSFAMAIVQIVLLDIVFSLDSVITAVGMADDLSVMVTAVVIAVAIMMFAARPVSEFVEHHPTVKVLALSFLLLIGCSLVAEGFGAHIPKGYIYFAMGFSVFVEMINLRASKKGKAVKLHDGYHPAGD